jgi:DNA polymerase I
MTDISQHTVKPAHVYLIDGSSFIFRAYFATFRNPMTRRDGTPVNAVFGFCNMLMKLLNETDADHICVVFDTARKTFRNEIYPEYKAHRPSPPDELIPQFDLVRKAVEAFNVSAIEMAGYEADDLIATYAKRASALGSEVTIVSIDKDLMQLVDDNISMLDTMKNKVIKHDDVVEKFGVAPNRVVDVQALAGDSSDNVPGVEGIGLKTAALLINEFGDLESLLARAGEIKQNKRREKLIEQAAMARTSKELVTLCVDVPIDVPLSDFKKREINAEKLCAFFDEQNFKTLSARISTKYGVASPEEIIVDVPSQSGGLAMPSMAELCSRETKYELVQDETTLKRWVDAAMLAGVVAVDTETDSLNAMSANLVGVSLSYEVGKACYIPLRHTSGKAAQGTLFGEDDNSIEIPKQVPFNKAIALLKPLLESQSVLKVGQNIKYDMLVLSNADNGGINVAPIDDTMILSYLNDGAEHGHGMDELSELHIGFKPISFKEVCGTGKTQITFDLVELEKARDYAAEDADITLRLHRLLKPKLHEARNVNLYETMERPLIPILALMERNGIKVDAQELRLISDEFAVRLIELERDIHKLAGKEFNIASPKQLGEVLFDDLGLAGGKKGKTGAYQTGIDILEKLAETGHELPVKIMEFRQLSKLKSTYADALINQVNAKTKRVHTSFMQAVTSTGRLSSSDPNLQNIPIRTEEGRRIRRAFVPEAGHILMAADYSQIELRLLAHVAGIDTLKEAFHAGVDIHALTASQVFGVPVEGMDPMVRRNAKAINFGIIYGQSQYGLAKQLGISNDEAKTYINAYFEQYPGIRQYMDKVKEEAREFGYVTTLFGRKCFIPGINDSNGARRAYGERAAINAPIQGGAADIIKRAMIRLPDALKSAGLSSKLLLQVHDELVLEVLPEEQDKTANVLKSVMEGAADLSVPLVVEIGTGQNWQEAH